MSDDNPLARHGRLSYLEVPAADPHRSGAFYAEVFGWKIDPRGGNDVRFADGDGLLIGRFAGDRAPSRDSGLVPFIYVRGIDAAVTRAQAAGGEVVEAIRPEGDLRIARVRDPGGNVIGIWEFSG